MNPEELKIGDLVRVIKDDYIIPKGTICKVTGISTTDLSIFGGHKPIVSLLTINTEDIRSMSCENIEGISLTKNILLKNGWKQNGGQYFFTLSEVFMGGDKDDEDNYTCFQLYYQNKEDGWVIDMRGEPLKYEIHYVHELQHLFFGLGLDSSMIV